MKNGLKRFFYTLIIATTLISCTSKINRKSFDQIKTGMEFTDVISILGEPTNSSSLSFGLTTGTSATWTNRNVTISIQFFNGRVKIKKIVEGVTTPREDE